VENAVRFFSGKGPKTMEPALPDTLILPPELRKSKSTGVLSNSKGTARGGPFAVCLGGRKRIGLGGPFADF
jgi:hypothetical protein